MRAQYVKKIIRRRVEYMLSPENRLALDIAENTGLRIGDILALTPAHLREAQERRGWATIAERKTGKTRKIHFTPRQISAMRAITGVRWVFPHRRDKTRHRTRESVYRNIKRAAHKLRINADGYSPHSYRKIYAVNELKRTGDLEAVQRKLNHKSIAVTAMYATSDKFKFKKPVSTIRGRTAKPGKK